jgi:hypothetical protein
VVRLVQVSIQAAVGHQFIYEQEITFVTTVKPSKELHKVSVPEPADYPHLRNKLLPALTGPSGYLLYGDVKVRICDEPPVDGPEASSSVAVVSSWM